MTTTKKGVRLGQLTTKLRGLTREYREAKDKLNSVNCRLYATAYQWVEVAISDGRHKNQQSAQNSLAATLSSGKQSPKVSVGSVAHWYHAGRFMREYGINPEKVRAGDVMTVAMRNRALTKAEVLRCVDFIKSGDHDQIREVVRKSKTLRKRGARKRARYLKNRGKLTPTACKMELMAAQSFLAELYGDSVAIVAYDEKDVELLSVK